ncbi:MAG TPA: hypothetical protein VM286_09815 [Candidatus Thermoplasmatota archaeon]|nr:hypothetical protein [Candidatus Thermoplasmatota archaeon]
MRIALLAVALLLAGCISPGSLGTDAPPGAFLPKPFLNAIQVGHNHTDFAQHVLSNNVELVGHDYLGPDGPPGGPAEIDVVGRYAYVALMGVGFGIVDLANVTHPTLVSVTEVAALANLPVVGNVDPRVGNPVADRYTADLKVDRTGDWVFIGMELSETPGVLIYDARDKTAPKLAGFWPEPGLLLGCHMVEYAVINEQEYLFCAPLDNAIYVGLLLPPTATGHREVVQVARFVPSTPKFVQQQVGNVQANPVGAAVAHVSGHQDMTYQLDPITKKPTLFVSFWNLGMRIVDVSVPALPLEIGSWAGEDSAKFRGALHTTVAFLSGDEKRIIVTIPEGSDPPALFVIDATDLDNPVLLSEWQALDDFQGEAGIFSMHNFQVMDGKVYIAMGHGGLWCLDISTPELRAAPDPVASYLPHMPAKDGTPYQGYYWDSVLYRGYWLTAEANGGFYVLHRDADPAGSDQYTSFA